MKIDKCIFNQDSKHGFTTTPQTIASMHYTNKQNLTVLVHFKTWTVFKWLLSKPAVFTYFVCIWSFGRAPSSKCILLVSFRARRAGMHTHTHTHTRTHTFQPGEQHLLCGLYFQRFIIKHVQQFSNCKDGIIQQSIDLILTLGFGQGGTNELWREGSCARRNAAIILRSQKSTKTLNTLSLIYQPRA